MHIVIIVILFFDFLLFPAKLAIKIERRRTSESDFLANCFGPLWYFSSWLTNYLYITFIMFKIYKYILYISILFLLSGSRIIHIIHIIIFLFGEVLCDDL